ncbi:hypothetical protein BDZ94DRAFT_1300839 [Collybia nuda]|uniref:BRCT domain-containing protein n=1 Tax=Collybia nuda TaxID=64659 RepID=A0A9P6CED8_9AGAR|nr:hypothetical protein BDZ94DRAFT_1300839 [Collybia nuda]
MKRRGNKSSKVPNVKLRPAQQGVLPRFTEEEHSTFWAQDSQVGSDDTSFLDPCPRPFRGLVVCATGSMDKPSLFKQALELGATSVSAFTDRVTHLVAVDHGGAKYMCALERKIPILKPSWIAESYKIWLRGDDVELEKSVAQHRLPIFSGVVLCPSGIADITERTQINKLLTEHQGVYVKNLERPVRVTHLLCSGDEETDKMRYAEKFNSKGEANVHLVWEEWFWDSLEYGGRFDEQRYQVRRPRPERKSLLEQASSPPPSSAVLSDQPEETLESHPRQLASQGFDEGEEEIAAVKRLPAVTLQLWGSLLKQRGYEVAGGELVRSPSKVGSSREPPPSPTKQPPSNSRNGSVISQFRRSNSFAPPRAETTSVQPFRRTRTTPASNAPAGGLGSFMASAPPPLPKKNGESSTSVVDTTTSNLFVGLKFLALGEAKSPSVRGAVEQNGGRMALEADEQEVDYVIVRLVSGSKLYRQEHDGLQRAKYRTECWLERCLFEDRICPPSDHVTFAPLDIETPILGADDIHLSFSGFEQSEACWIKRLIRALGINLAPFFSRRSTHLLCPSGTGDKFTKACEWNIPVVTMEWLNVMARNGTIPVVTEHLVTGSTFKVPQRHHTANDEMDVDPNAKVNPVDKGKGKAREEDFEQLGTFGGTFAKSLNGGDFFFPSQPTQASPQQMSTKELSFGQPTALLARPPQPQRSHSSTSTPSRSKSTTIDPLTRQNSVALPTASLSRSDPGREPTQQEIERERKQTRIPSSKSPSPMKIPRSLTRMLSASPTKLPKETKALQDNITSLLGKRLPSENDPLISAPAGKRARPQRKPQSRQPSEVLVSEISAVPVYTDSMSPFETYDDFNSIDEAPVEESMRVRYEDPGQQNEKKRLLNLLRGSTISLSDGGADGGEDKGGKATRSRRSTRIAGF